MKREKDRERERERERLQRAGKQGEEKSYVHVIRGVRRFYFCIILHVSIALQGATPAETPCTAITNGMASCMLRTRFAPRDRVSTTYMYFMCISAFTFFHEPAKQYMPCNRKLWLDKNFAKSS
jgi:hypothetical protein